MKHTHRSKTSTERGWSHCVTPDQCAAKPQRAEAHGNIVIIDTCSCGAIRTTEKNGRVTNRSPWVKER